MQYTEEQLKNMSLEDAQAAIGDAVYQASFLFESLEGAGKVSGNGHHIMQKLSVHAQDVMAERWTEKDAKTKAS